MKRILVIYHSQEHGNTTAAELVARGAAAVGEVTVEALNSHYVQRVDAAAVAACDGLALGTPDYFSYPAGTTKQFFDDPLVAERRGLHLRGKPGVIFMTQGGGGRPRVGALQSAGGAIPEPGSRARHLPRQARRR